MHTHTSNIPYTDYIIHDKYKRHYIKYKHTQSQNIIYTVTPERLI